MSKQNFNFDLTDPLVPVQIACGLLYVPHIVFKLTGMSGAVAFFAKAGFNPPLAFVVLAIVAESVCAVALTLRHLDEMGRACLGRRDGGRRLRDDRCERRGPLALEPGRDRVCRLMGCFVHSRGHTRLASGRIDFGRNFLLTPSSTAA